jgi:hypothetical protein
VHFCTPQAYCLLVRMLLPLLLLVTAVNEFTFSVVPFVKVITIIQSFSSFSKPVGVKLPRQASAPTFPALLLLTLPLFPLRRGPTPPYSSVPDLPQPGGHPGCSLHELQPGSLPVEPI